MTDFSDWKILKTDLPAKQEEYSAVAAWCNNSGEYHIEEQGVYYAVVANAEPTEDEMKAAVRVVRNKYLQDTDFTQLNDAPFTSEEKLQYAQYREYLRDYTESADWWLQNPLTFDEWKE